MLILLSQENEQLPPHATKSVLQRPESGQPGHRAFNGMPAAFAN
jgi:hypothetical protein